MLIMLSQAVVGLSRKDELETREMKKYRIITVFTVLLMLGTAILWGQHAPPDPYAVSSGPGTAVEAITDVTAESLDVFGDLPYRGNSRTEAEADSFLTSPAEEAGANQQSSPAATPEPTSTPVPTVTPEPTSTPVPTVTPYPVETDAAGIIQEGMSVDAFTADDTVFYVHAYEANIRKLPRTDSDIMTKVTMGDKLTRTGYGLNWSKIKTSKGQTGYILTSLITTEVIHKPIPTAAPTPKPTPTPTPKPTASPTAAPTASPTAAPAPDPTTEAAAEPATEPTTEATTEPATEPTNPPEQNDEYDLLARIIALEGSPKYGYDGYLAIASVIMNQVASPKFPNTVTGVLSAPGHFSTYLSTRKPNYNDAVYQAASDAYYQGKRNLPIYVIAFITPARYEINVAAGGSFSRMEVYQIAYGAVWCYYAADAG